MKRLWLPLEVCLVAAILVACADKPLAPIEDRSRPGTSKVEQRYTVLRGDTLFSIAFRYGLDFRRLAAANSIASPYTIFPGQKLHLAEAQPPLVSVSVATPASVATPTAAAAPTAATAPKTQTPTVAKVRAKAPTSGADERSSVVTPSKSLATKPTSSTSSSAATAGNSASVTKAASTAANVPVSSWRWPIQGRVSRRFDKNLHKGVDVSGKRGDSVLATAGGRVVYAGSGIAGYGLMLIVRHNDEYLSAYGHNDALLVDEGDVVRGGQKIAERGSSGTDSVKLHFEIRRRGRPVDPLQLLPRR